MPRNSLAAVFAAGLAPRAKALNLSAVNPGGGGWFNVIREGFTGAWQQNVVVDEPRSVVAFGAVFSCITIIASDIAKLCAKLVQEDANGICSPAAKNSPYWATLRKPNHFQTRIKFIEQWIVSKLLYGNTYVLKARADLRGMVTGLYVLDPQRVKVLVADSGDVYYEIAIDHLSGVKQTITVPASEVIHDMMVSLWHPLVGISPIYACGLSATMGNRIQTNSTRFFQNMSRPSGQLTGPGTIPDATAERLKAAFEENFGNGNLGRIMVAGDGLKYEPMTIPAGDAQLIEQLRWTIEDVARCFHVPLYKLGAESGRQAGTLSIEALGQAYYSDCLQALIESLECCFDEGLGLPAGYHVEMDLDGLLRMDTAARFTAWGEAMKAGWISPNEVRAKEDFMPVPGGESPYLQEQNWPLNILASRQVPTRPPTAPSDPNNVPKQIAPVINLGNYAKGALRGRLERRAA